MTSDTDEITDKSKEPMSSFTAPLNDESRSRPVRRSGKDRSSRLKDSGNSHSLDKSFTEFLDTSAPDEIEEFNAQVESTMSSLPKSLSESLDKAERRPSGEQYKPVRRPSRAGSVLAKTMKETAAAALLELEGLIDDDYSDDDLNGLGAGDVDMQS